MVGRVAPQDLRGQGAIMVISTICQKAVELSSRQSIPSKRLRRKKKSAHHTQSKDFNGMVCKIENGFDQQNIK